MDNFGELFSDDSVIEAIAKGRVKIDIGWETVNASNEVKPYVRITPITPPEVSSTSYFWPMVSIVVSAALGYNFPTLLAMVANAQ
jgi:hypothetical protein